MIRDYGGIGEMGIFVYFEMNRMFNFVLNLEILLGTRLWVFFSEYTMLGDGGSRQPKRRLKK